MAWNIEIAAIHSPKRFPLGKLVPDVFEATNQLVGWEDATSVVRDRDLSVAWVAGWAILIDVSCRLSEATPYLKEVSAERDVFIFRVANEPIEVHYKKGKVVWKHVGLAAVLRGLGRDSPQPGEFVDGETIAPQWIQQRVGLAFTEDFWKAKYSIYTLPF